MNELIAKYQTEIDSGRGRQLLIPRKDLAALLAMARRAAEHCCPEVPMTTDEFEEPEEE